MQNLVHARSVVSSPSPPFSSHFHQAFMTIQAIMSERSEPMDAPPPEYDLDERPSLPVYSTHVGRSERTIQLEPFKPTGCPDCDWIYHTEHMTINIGSRVWALHAPSYGLNGRIEGSVKLFGNHENERITATLEGYLSTGAPGRTSIFRNQKSLILSRTVSLIFPRANGNSCAEEQFFSICIPTEVHIEGALSKLPPSYVAHYPSSWCNISYSLKFVMIRKGQLRRESINVPILYLPKSRPSAPPLSAIPRPSLLGLIPTSYTQIKTISIAPSWSTSHKRGRERQSWALLGDLAKSINFSFPASEHFSSGQFVPFTLSLVFPDYPVIAKFYMHDVRVELLKRLCARRRSRKKRDADMVVHDMRLARAKMGRFKEYDEGVSLMRGLIRVGSKGRESSWRLEGIAETQYILRVTLRPPDEVISYLPSFKHDEVLEITTDSWSALESELAAPAGTPLPALGLASSLVSKPN